MSRLEDLAPFIKDEEDAHKVYSEMAEEAERSGMPEAAELFRGMAADELRHHDILERMWYGARADYEQYLQREKDRAEEYGRRTGRTYPSSYSDWVELAEKVKARHPNDPVMRASANYSLGMIAQEGDVEASVGKAVIESAKRWLVTEAGEPSVT